MKTTLSVSIIAVVSICSLIVIIVLARVADGVPLTLWDGVALIASIIVIYFLNKKNLIKDATDSIEKKFSFLKEGDI